MRRKWLKVLMLAMMVGASFGSPMNPKEIEDLMYIMNQTRIEFTVPDEDDDGEGGKTGIQGARHVNWTAFDASLHRWTRQIGML